MFLNIKYKGTAISFFYPYIAIGFYYIVALSMTRFLKNHNH